MVFVLDASRSVTEKNFGLMRQFVKNFLSNADVDGGNVRVGVMIYSNDVNIQFHLNEHTTKSDVFAAVDAIPYTEGSTNTAKALKVMRTEMFRAINGDRPKTDNIAIVITDGYATQDEDQIIPEAEISHNAGIHIFSIGIGLADLAELDSLASKPVSENRFAVENFGKLDELAKRVFDGFCSK